MKIIVLMKQVVNKDVVLRIKPDGSWIEESDVALQTSESDGYALEEALRLREAKGEGEVIVCSLSPYQIAKMISEAIKEEKPDLIFTGLQSDDLGYGQTGVILAELLGIPHATIVIEIDRSSARETIRVKRELENGWYQWFTYKLPALFTIQSGISQIRYASLKGIMEAKKKEIKEVKMEVFDFASAQKIEKVYLPIKTKQTQILGDGDAKRGAIELVEKLRNEVRVI